MPKRIRVLRFSALPGLVLGLLLLLVAQSGPAWAQTCNQSNILDYTKATAGDRRTATETVSATSFTYSGYTTSSPTTYTFAAGTVGALSGNTLIWQENNTNQPLPNQATITLTFTRPVTNLTLRFQDLDADPTNSFTDYLKLDGYPTTASSTAATLTASNFTVGARNTFAGAGTNAIKGISSGAVGDASATATVTFSTPVQRLVLTYTNPYAYTAGALRQQTLGINSVAWCAQSDISSTLTGPGRAQAGSTVTYTSTTKNVSGDAVTTITPTVQLPAGLSGVTGGTYTSTSGLLTLPTISNLAAGASTAQLITYTMPATNAVSGTSAFTSTANDLVSTNNTSTISTIQNRAPVASDVTNSPAILNNTTSQTNIASFNATDPDAATGNTTITSYTILSLPTTAQGKLYVGGTAAVLNQVITVPTTATTTAPGYQLSFVPTSGYSGTASFTYRATDDTGTNSNTANYYIPVTPGADLVSTVNGSTIGVEGQSKTYSAMTTNNGPATATNVVPTLTLSGKPPFSSVTVTNGTYDPTTGIITFNAIASLASGASVLSSAVLVVQPTPATFTVTAASTSAIADPTPANNNGTAAAAILTAAISPIGPAGVASACATPSKDGSPTLSTNPNTYYPASNQTVASGAISFTVGAATGTTLTPIAAGDLLLIIQMQGADINATNTDAYGDGVAGGFATNNLNNANFTAGQYEYVVASGAVPTTGGTVTITTGLKNGYQNADATTTTGQRRFQVVRIPQYKNATISGTVSPKAWDGITGGVLALDVTGKLSFAAGARLDASGLGFRGGAGQKLTGTTGLTNTDFRSAAPTSTTATAGAHAMKGEGTVGTPRFVNTGTNIFDTGVDGYPSGSAGRGAPGNAGGGGTDASPSNNSENSGGGGGGNGSRGGRGGNSWSSNLAIGGEPGGGFNPPSSSRLIMGGGGGAGSTNNGTGTGIYPGYASSGVAGGGIVLVRAGSVAGLGSVLANGASANNTAQADGSGGGGAGGSILLTVNNTSSLGTLSLSAAGGSGGTNNPGATTGHGPGGGGGGGIILTNAAVASAAVAGGTNGTTTGGAAFGAEAGLVGIANTQISNSIANSTAGINCSVDVTATLTAPTQAAAAQTVSVSAVFANNGGVGAAGVTRTVTLASGSSATGDAVTNVVAPGSSSISANATTGDVTITYPSASPLAAGASSQFNISYTAPGTLSVVTTANTTTTSTDAILENNTSSATTAITGYADVVGVIFGLGSSTTGRTSGTYGALFANNGPAAALNVTRKVTLPPGATLTTDQLKVLTDQGATYNSGTGVIDFGNLPTLNSRDVSVFRFTYTASNTGGSSAIVSSITTTSQEDASNGTGAANAPDTFTFPITNNAAADVATDGITTSAATVVPGQQASFTINFRNFGPASAINAMRSAQLTPGLSGVTVSDGGTYDPATGIVSYPTIASMANGTLAASTITFLAPATGLVNASGSMTTGPGSVSSGIFANNEATASIAVTPVADVATTISGPTASVVGNLVTFAVTTSNNGPSPAAGVVQTVQLPTGLATAGVFPSSQGTYNPANGVVTFPAVGVLAGGTVLNNTVSFAMPATSFTASAGVSTSTPESGATANNSVAAATTTGTAVAANAPLANVYNTLSFSTKSVAPGAPVTFTVLTGNNGPSPAENVEQRIFLPLGLSVTGITNSGTYSNTTGVLIFPALTTLASGSMATNTFTLTAPATGPLVAMASVASTTADPVPGDNLLIRTLDITSVADVATLLVGPGVASATQVTVFSVTTLNNGPVAAANVMQTVSIPAGLAPADVTTTGSGVYDPATGLITWPAVASLAVGEQRNYTYSYVAPAFASTDASNPRVVQSQALVSSSTPGGVTTNNSASVSTLIKWNSDVAVAISGPSTGLVGNPVVFTVSTTNNGPAPAATVNTSVRIATGLNVVASGGGVYDITTGIVTFPAITRQAVGVTGVVTNTITVISPDRPLVGASAAADIPTATNDINLANNAVTIYLPLSPITATQTDLQTTITADRTSQQAGQPIVLTVTATNANSTGMAADIQEQVSLPGGLGGVVVSNGGTYYPASGAVNFPRVSGQPANSPLTYTITVNDPGNDPLVATAAINGSLSDPQPSNNTQTVSVNIIPVADVATRLLGPATMLPGGLVSYGVVTVNNGPSPANAVAQTVQLPTSLTGVSVTGGGTYDASSGLVTFPVISTQAVGKAGEVVNTISFAFPVVGLTITGSVTSGTSENAATKPDNTASLTTALTNQMPLASASTNRLQAPIGNTASPLLLSALNGFDTDGSVASFTIQALPDPAAGVLALKGTAVAVNQPISLADVANLTFDPAATFVGNTFFAYTATDNQGAVSVPALYTIAVGQDNTSLYTSTQLKGGASQYQNGDIIATVFDANGGAYSATAAVTDNGVRTASLTSGNLPAGTRLDPATGQVTVLNRTLLVAGTYPVSITTIDANGGTNTQMVPLQIGSAPLPVELTSFAAKAAGLDGQLQWTTAQELNNAGFHLERSFDGTSFETLAFVAGAGTSSQPHRYSLVDKGVGQHAGPVYYRLRQVDDAGKTTYSPVRTLTFDPAAVVSLSVSLYPNPAVAQTTLDLRQLPAGSYQVSVVDMAGRVVQTKTLAGGVAHVLAVENLLSGSYLLVIRHDGLQITQRLLKQ